VQLIEQVPRHGQQSPKRVYHRSEIFFVPLQTSFRKSSGDTVCEKLIMSQIFMQLCRGVAGGVCSACARLGGMASPLIAMTRYLFPELPYIIFAVLAFFSGEVHLKFVNIQSLSPITLLLESTTKYRLQDEAKHWSSQTKAKIKIKLRFYARYLMWENENIEKLCYFLSM